MHTLHAAALCRLANFKAVALAAGRGERAQELMVICCEGRFGMTSTRNQSPLLHGSSPPVSYCPGPLAQQPWGVLQAWVLLVAPIVPASKRDAEDPGPPLLLFSR